MKKTILIMLICLLALTTIGCSFSEAKKTTYLEKEEFYIYEDGNLIEESKEPRYSSVGFHKLLENNLERRKLETKRGIVIGSKAEEIAIKYKDVLCSVIFDIDNQFYSNVYNSFPEQPENLIPDLQNRVSSEKQVLNYYMVRYNTYYVNEQLVRDQEFFDYLKSLGIDRNEADRTSISIENAEVYILLFFVIDNVVTEIFMNIY